MEKKIYFIDFESCCVEDDKIHGDLGWESGISDTRCESIEEAKNSIRLGWEIEGEYYEDGSFPIYSVFEGLYDLFDEEWYVPAPHNREYVYRIACCSQSEGARLGIDANEFIG